MKAPKKKKKIVPEKKKTIDGRFIPGVSDCPTGRPKGTANKYSIAELFHSLEKVEKKKRKTLLTLYCERAFDDEDPRVLLHLVDRFLPALKAIEMSGSLNAMPVEIAQAIQKILRERYGKEQIRKVH